MKKEDDPFDSYGTQEDDSKEFAESGLPTKSILRGIFGASVIWLLVFIAWWIQK
jgi:hypothetical protein